MKKIISSLLVMSMVFCASIAKADNLTVEQAKTVGCYYMVQQTGIEKITPEHLTLIYQFENLEMNVPSAYVFNVNGCGWVIVAGSSVVNPIIAFSETGSLDMNNIPDNMRWFLTIYTDEISEIQLLDAENDYPDNEEYTSILKQGPSNGTKDDGDKIILLRTHWGQGSNYNPTYNYYCPKVGNRYCVTGCVATALAQMCRYYEYPKQPKGVVSTTFDNGTSSTSDDVTLKLKLDTISFNYSRMPTYLSNNSSSTEIREVAMLNYALGLMVDMDYGIDGSASTMASAVSSLRSRFKYQSGVMSMRRENDADGWTDTTWMNTLRRNLMNNDVVVIRGASSTGGGADAAGHAWVVGGYMTGNVNRYYMNWGWEGSGDGFYNLGLNEMRPNGTGYNFNTSLGCLFGVVPPEDSNIHHNHAAIHNVTNDILGTAYPNPATLSVSLPYATESVADMQVFSIDGKLVATRRLQPGTGEVTLRVDALPKGVYIYRLNGKSSKFIVR